MNNQIGFVFKILLLSAGLSMLIKYGGQQILVQPTTTLVLTIVCLPSLLIGLVLGRKYYEE